MSKTANIWTISALNELTGVDRRTIKKRLESLTPTDGGYSAKQALPLIYASEVSTPEGKEIPSIFESDARYAAARAELAEVKLANARNELIPAAQVSFVWDATIITLRQKILNLENLTDDEKAEILTDLQSIPIDEYFETPLESEDGQPAEGE